MPEPEGFGTFALGIVAAGMWGFSEDPDESEPEGVRFLDPATRDYAEADGELVRTTSTRQRVMNLLQNAFGSSMAMRGIKMPTVHTPSTSRDMDREVRTVLRPLTDEQTIEVRSVRSTIEKDGVPGRLGVDVDYLDIRTGETESVTV